MCFLELHAQLLGWQLRAAWYLLSGAPCPHWVWRFPWVGTVTLQHLGRSQGTSAAAQLSVSRVLPAPMLESSFLCFRAFLNILRKRQIGAELGTFQSCDTRGSFTLGMAVSQPDCSLSCPSCCSLSRSWHSETSQRPASSPATGKMFFLCVFPSSFPSKPLLMAVLLP